METLNYWCNHFLLTAWKDTSYSTCHVTSQATFYLSIHLCLVFLLFFFLSFFSSFLFSFSYVLPRGCLYIYTYIYDPDVLPIFYHAAQGAEKLLNEACASTDTCVNIPGTNVELTCDVIAKRCCKLLLLNFLLVHRISSQRGITYRWILAYRNQTICIHFSCYHCNCLYTMTFDEPHISWMSNHRSLASSNTKNRKVKRCVWESLLPHITVL